MSLFNWSQTASTNATSDPTINWAEGMAPSGVNDSGRAMMAATAKWRDDIAGAITTGGTSTAYTVTSFSGFDTLAHLAGQVIAFTPHTTNGATVTLNVDGLGAKPLRASPNVELQGGTLIQGTPYTALYNNSDGAFYLFGLGVNSYSIPLGASMEYWGSTAPNSAFAFPYGQAISRTTYATLFTLFGTTYGTGDGSTTFNIPDLRGRVVACLDNMGGTAKNSLQVSTTISTTSGSASATVGSASGIALGAYVVSTNVPSGTTVTAISGTTITLSANATATASGTAARFSAISDAQALGGTGGGPSQTLATANLPPYTPAGSISGTTSPQVGASPNTYTSATAGGSVTTIQYANTSFATPTLSGTFTGTAQGGASTPLTTVPPAIVCNRILRII